MNARRWVALAVLAFLGTDLALAATDWPEMRWPVCAYFPAVNIIVGGDDDFRRNAVGNEVYLSQIHTGLNGICESAVTTGSDDV